MKHACNLSTERLRQENCKFESSVGHTEGPFLKTESSYVRTRNRRYMATKKILNRLGLLFLFFSSEALFKSRHGLSRCSQERLKLFLEKGFSLLVDPNSAPVAEQR